MTSSLPGVSQKVPIWRDIRALRWAFQIVILIVVGAIVYWLYNNYQVNVSRSNIPTNLKFLDNPAHNPRQ